MQSEQIHDADGRAPAVPAREALSVLIIDDESHVRTFLRAALRSLGINAIFEATNGEDGVAKFAELQPTLVLLDVNMPVMRGEVAIQRILAHDPQAAVVMVTTECQHDTVRHFLNLGAMGYILKHRPADGVRTALAELVGCIEFTGGN